MARLREPVVKSVGKPDAGNRHVRFDERGRETTGCHSVPVQRPSSTLPNPISEHYPGLDRGRQSGTLQKKLKPDTTLKTTPRRCATPNSDVNICLLAPCHRGRLQHRDRQPPTLSGCLIFHNYVAHPGQGFSNSMIRGFYDSITPATCRYDQRREFTGVSARRQQSDAERAALDAAIAQTAEAVVVTDSAGTIQYVNPAFTRMTGFSSEEALGRNPRMLKSGKQEAAFYERMWRTISAGKVWNGELINQRKDGSFYAEEMSITPVRDALGAIARYIAIKRDVTERRADEN